MSKHNYSQYSNKQKNFKNTNVSQNKPVVKTPAAKPEVELVQETVETVTLPATVEGIVVNCARLNVRENATVDSGVVCVLDAMSEIQIDVNKSTENWFYVLCATGAEGYCMREYIDAHL